MSRYGALHLPNPGARVVIDAGRYGGREGTLARYDLVQSGQLRLYPVVRLDDGREVRVATVSPPDTTAG